MPPGIELGPIRPPSEAYSLLVRATRNCPWNRCRFCHTYNGTRFSLRTVDEIKQDIDMVGSIRDEITDIAVKSGYADRISDVAAMVLSNPPAAEYYNVALWMYKGGKTCFLQDANSLIMRTGEMLEVLQYLKEKLPSIERVTSYARSKTAARKTVSELRELREAGLSRLHVGIESGYDDLLKYIDKGCTSADHIKGGRNIIEAGISLCEYVLLGLGGREMWKDHAVETARTLNAIDPDFIRFRTLVVKDDMALYEDMEKGLFTRCTDDDLAEEQRLLMENLDCHSTVVSDHIDNLLEEIQGTMPDDRERLIAVIDRYRALSERDRLHFRVGRRTGRYTKLDDINDPQKYNEVERILNSVAGDNYSNIDDIIFRLMERFI